MKIKLALSPDETRAALGIGRTTMYNLIASGKLRAVRVNRRLIVPLAEVERFLSENSSVNPPAVNLGQRKGVD